jgi:hypothetical protein
MATLNPFSYSPLFARNDCRTPIRLLQLLPGSGGAPLTCNLVHVFLEDKPAYEALSYCWGDMAYSIPIQCGADCLTITPNLQAALLSLRRKNEIRIIWVDALCINQNDHAERSRQVRIMKNIYQAARTTLVWLGSDDEDTRKGLQLVPYLHQVFVQAFNGMPHVVGRQSHILKHHSVTELKKQRPLFELFQNIEQRPYFSRVWIIQELAVSWKNVDIICGPDKISWVEYLAAAFTFSCLRLSNSNPRSPLGSFMQLAETATSLAIPEYPRLVTLLDKYRGFESTDPRDKVYALLGLAEPKDISSLAVEVNYQLDVEDIFTRLAVSYLQKDDNFDILSYVHRGSNLKGLPTWVPDWTKQDIISTSFRSEAFYNVSGFPFQAGGVLVPSITISTDKKILTVDGIVIDKIRKTGCLVKHDKKCNCSHPRPARDFHDWAEIAGLHDTGEYISGGSVGDAFIITMTAGHPLTKFATVKEDFVYWYRRMVLSDLVKNGESIRPASAQQVRDPWLEAGTSRMPQEIPSKTLQQSMIYCNGRRFGVTSKKYFALLPGEAVEEDVIAIFKGGKYPFVLRKEVSGWSLVGECYIHGIMRGEMVDEGAFEKLTIL